VALFFITRAVLKLDLLGEWTRILKNLEDELTSYETTDLILRITDE
jgi:hypothetical protein